MTRGTLESRGRLANDELVCPDRVLAILMLLRDAELVPSPSVLSSTFAIAIDGWPDLLPNTQTSATTASWEDQRWWADDVSSKIESAVGLQRKCYPHASPVYLSPTIRATGMLLFSLPQHKLVLIAIDSSNSFGR